MYTLVNQQLIKYTLLMPPESDTEA